MTAPSAYLPNEDVLRGLLDRALKSSTSPRRSTSRGADDLPLTPRIRSTLVETTSVGAAHHAGAAQHPPASPSASRLSSPSHPEIGSGPDPSALQELNALLHATPSIDGRFSAFATWLRRHAGLEAVFIVDEEGLPMIEDGAEDDQRALAGSLARPLEAAKAVLPSMVRAAVRLTLRSGKYLELSWCDTALGRFALGTTSVHPLSLEWSTQITELLKDALERSGRFASSVSSGPGSRR